MYEGIPGLRVEKVYKLLHSVQINQLAKGKQSTAFGKLVLNAALGLMRDFKT